MDKIKNNININNILDVINNLIENINVNKQKMVNFEDKINKLNVISHIVDQRLNIIENK